jgi:hypothetical protein
LTSIFHKKGDSIPPGGHPRQTDLEKVESWTEIAATLLERKLCTIFLREPGQERFAREAMIAGCHAESKALLMYRNAAALTFHSSKADSIKEVREWAADWESTCLHGNRAGSHKSSSESGYTRLGDPE